MTESATQPPAESHATVAQMPEGDRWNVKTPQANSPSQEQQPESSLLKMGIGLQCGIRFHQPEEYNDFVTDIWNSILAEHVYAPVDEKRIGPGALLALNGTFDIGTLVTVIPFVQGMWAGKQFYFRGAEVKDVHINTYTAMGGLNVLIRVINREAFTIRLGAGGYGTRTITRITGDAFTTIFGGNGYGFKGLLGTEMRLSKDVVLTFDCAVPYGKAEFKKRSDITATSGYTVRYPTRFDHFGFEVCPGVVFYF
jgi:hypothetical protein